jgi:hydroxylamine dehydrogenase
MMRRVAGLLLILCCAAANSAATECITCHQRVTPQIVSDWQLSVHSKNAIDCASCHGTGHRSAEDVANLQMPTPQVCGECHEVEVGQFTKGKHALAWAAMKAMPTAHWQPMALTEGMKGCGGCHKVGLKSGDQDTGRRIWWGILRCLPHPAPFLRERSQRTPKLPNMPHGY